MLGTCGYVALAPSTASLARSAAALALPASRDADELLDIVPGQLGPQLVATGVVDPFAVRGGVRERGRAVGRYAVAYSANDDVPRVKLHRI